MRLVSALRLLIIATLLLSVAGCGYKPTSKYSRKVTGEKISTSVVISAQDPENTVVIKDAVDAAILEIFHASLTDRAHANTHLSLSISAPSYSPIQYNDQGYVISYRATIRLGITRKTGSESKHYTTTGTYDFAIDPNAIITDQQRYDAIKYSSIKAISSFIAKVSAEGSRKKE